MIENVVEIPTQVLLETPIKTTPLFYVAGVVMPVSMYLVLGHILGAGDSTTDPYGRITEKFSKTIISFSTCSLLTVQKRYLHCMHVTTSMYLSLLE